MAGGNGPYKGVSTALQNVLRNDAAAPGDGDAKSNGKGKGKAQGRRTERSKGRIRAADASVGAASDVRQARSTRKRARDSNARQSRKLVFKRMRTDPARKTFIGVAQTQKGDRWRAQLQVQGVRHNLGSFLTANAAALAYDRAAARMLGRGVGQRNFKRVRVYEDLGIEGEVGESDDEEGEESEQHDVSERDDTDMAEDDDDVSHSGEGDDDEEDCEDEDEDEDDEEDGEGEGLRTGNHADGNGEDTDESAAESDTDVPDFVGVGRSSDATSHVPWRINV